MDCDKIVVMNAGMVAECGPPLELLQKEGSMLRAMGIDSGGLENLILLAQRTQFGDMSTSPPRSDRCEDKDIVEGEETVNVVAQVKDV